MNLPALQAVYEAARTWTLQPIAHPPPGWAPIVRRGMASWIELPPPAMEAPKPWQESARLDVSPLLTLVAAMIAEVCP